jgi:hypothetical protein
MQKSIYPVLTAFIPPAIILLLHIFAMKFYFYSSIPHLDIPMHFMGGMAMATSAILLINYVEKIKIITIKNNFVRAIILVTFVSAIACYWEIYEFIFDTFWGSSLQMGVFDTMKDLLIGITGSIIVITSWSFGKKR